jgi:hypothetical protein
VKAQSLRIQKLKTNTPAADSNTTVAVVRDHCASLHWKIILIITRLSAGSLSTKLQVNPGAQNRQPPDLSNRALQPSRSLGRLWQLEEQKNQQYMALSECTKAPSECLLTHVHSRALTNHSTLILI